MKKFILNFCSVGDTIPYTGNPQGKSFLPGMSGEPGTGTIRSMISSNMLRFIFVFMEKLLFVEIKVLEKANA